MDLKEIRSLVDLMKKNGIAVFKLQRENFKITLKTNEAGQPMVVSAAPASPAPAPPAATPAPESTAANPTAGDKEIKSPMVGTFYASPSPDSPAFVGVGSTVSPDTVVCIVEAMKVMNEVKAEVSGVITEVCAENGKAVQFGQALFRLK
jgi:acetyl-CoA carboxylase biotin carboxyl carrier protein